MAGCLKSVVAKEGLLVLFNLFISLWSQTGYANVNPFFELFRLNPGNFSTPVFGRTKLAPG